MTPLRLVSFLPSATEMTCALGLADQLVGITHCCDFPPEVRAKPRIVSSNIPGGDCPPKEIDRAVTESLRPGASLYTVDEILLRKLAPTHILTQDLCQVCAPSGSEITRALAELPGKPQVLRMSPNSIADIHKNIRELGQSTGRENEAENLIARGQACLQQIAESSGLLARPRVFCAEWIDPLFCAGHWIPEMVEIAGGIEPLGRKWAKSVRINWEEVREAAPEIVILMLCGLQTREAQSHASWLCAQPGWSELPAVRNNRVFAVDTGYFSRPGPRVIEGMELLAHLFHPDVFDWRGPASAWTNVR